MGRFPLVDKEIVSEEKHKPVLDEQTLANLLEAAYVLQEHNRERQEIDRALELKRDQLEAEAQSKAAAVTPQAPDPAPAANSDYTFTLAKIVATQHQIQVRQLELDSAMSLVAERLVPMARASGAAIAILEGNNLRYRAASGTLTLPVGTNIPMEKALCLACLRTSQVFSSADIGPEFLIDPEECRRRGIQSLIAVPVFHDGGVAGGLEVYYPNTHGFTEQDIHTCQLMAGLITEALARDEEVTSKKSLATERAAMLQALEALKPNLTALVDKSATKDSGARAIDPTSAASASAQTFECRNCGHKLVGEEQFCGNCGTPRNSDHEATSLQSKIASLSQLREIAKEGPAADLEDDLSVQGTHAQPPHPLPEELLADSIEVQMAKLVESAGIPRNEATGSSEMEGPISAEFEDSILSDLEMPSEGATEEVVQEEAIQKEQSTALVKPERGAAWSSAANARAFLEELASTQRPGSLIRQFWNTRRGDIYLAIAVLLVIVALRWGIWSNHSVSATGSSTAAAAAHRKPAPEPELSMFDRMLISLGLAEAPPTPEYKGNPATQVWVDLHTALYYCPGADLYGKTPKGKFTSQREAQLDQFEPAYRKMCD
jgi:GAF domain-containing protein